MPTNTDHDGASEAREKFLRLRDAVGLPRGGEITHKHEAKQIARHLGIDPAGMTLPRLNYEIIYRAKEWRYNGYEYEWEWAKDSERDYTYLQSREANMIAELAEAINQFDWVGEDA